MLIRIRTTEYNCCWQHSLCTITQNETTEETSFWANYEYNSKIWQNCKCTNYKVKNDTKHYKDQEIAQRSDEQNSATDRMNNKDKIFCN
jgi:hypothetical protein